MNQAKQAAARSWRSTLSSEGEMQVKEPLAKKAAEGPGAEEDKETPTQHAGRDERPPMDMQSVQQQAWEARWVGG